MDSFWLQLLALTRAAFASVHHRTIHEATIEARLADRKARARKGLRPFRAIRDELAAAGVE